MAPGQRANRHRAAVAGDTGVLLFVANLTVVVYLTRRTLQEIRHQKKA